MSRVFPKKNCPPNLPVNIITIRKTEANSTVGPRDLILHTVAEINNTMKSLPSIFLPDSSSAKVKNQIDQARSASNK